MPITTSYHARGARPGEQMNVMATEPKDGLTVHQRERNVKCLIILLSFHTCFVTGLKVAEALLAVSLIDSTEDTHITVNFFNIEQPFFADTSATVTSSSAATVKYSQGEVTVGDVFAIF